MGWLVPAAGILAPRAKLRPAGWHRLTLAVACGCDVAAGVDVPVPARGVEAEPDGELLTAELGVPEALDGPSEALDEVLKSLDEVLEPPDEQAAAPSPTATAQSVT